MGVLLGAPLVRFVLDRGEELEQALPILARNTVEGMTQLLRNRADVLASLEEVFTLRAMEHDESQPRFAGLPVQVDQFYVDSVDGVSDVDVMQVLEVGDGTFDVEVILDLAASLDVYVRKSEAFAYEGDDIRFSDYDWNEGFAAGSLSRRVGASAWVVYDPAEEMFVYASVGSVWDREY